MKITREKVDSGIEKQIVIALATNEEFLGKAAGLVDTTLFQSPHAARVADWCLTYWRKYSDPPMKELELMFGKWVENEEPREQESEAVSELLSHLSDLYDQTPVINAPHLAASTATYLNKRKLTLLSERTGELARRGDIEDGIALVQSFRQVRDGQRCSYDLLGGKAITDKTYAEPADSIICMGDQPAQQFFGRSLRRGAFIGIQGPEKRGKSWWCMEFVYRALRSRKKVALFVVGDETDTEINMRWDVRVAGIPIHPQVVEKPYEISLEKDGNESHPVVLRNRIVFDHGIDPRIAADAHKTFKRRFRLREDEVHIKAFNYPSGTINVQGIDDELKKERDESGFVPDVIVIDYMDILAPEKERRDLRDQSNETWARTKRLAQEWSACVIAPTQADADSYDVRTQSMKNFSNDKRKNAHVNALIGLNQTTEEKEMGVMRLNWILRRDSDFNSKKCLWVAQCLPLGMAMARSAW